MPNRSSVQREEAVDALIEEKTEQALKGIIDALNDRLVQVRLAAAEGLSHFSTNSSVEALITALKDRNDLVRVAAAESLGYLGSDAAVDALLEALSDKSFLVRSWVASALGDINYAEEKVTPRLKNMLVKERSSLVRLQLYYALYKFGDESVLPMMLSFLFNRSYKLRCAAANSLADILNVSNKDIILESLRRAEQVEPTIAAQSSIQNAISSCDSDSIKIG